ncbi:unnamed protein product [Durusdinium trenchii]|uniref:Ion transport domain-containing protein n=1 Tax=Durusdinium trenchii TaxID=1381693 RepID=A0ABP0JUC4_9DINO
MPRATDALTERHPQSNSIHPVPELQGLFCSMRTNVGNCQRLQPLVLDIMQVDSFLAGLCWASGCRRKRRDAVVVCAATIAAGPPMPGAVPGEHHKVHPVDFHPEHGLIEVHVVPATPAASESDHKEEDKKDSASRLWWAAYNEDILEVEKILEDLSKDTKDSEGKQVKGEILKMNLKYVAHEDRLIDRFRETFPTGVTVLGAAMLGGNAEIVKLLLEKKALLGMDSAETEMPESKTHCTCEDSDVEILCKLLRRQDITARETLKALLLQNPEEQAGLGKLQNHIHSLRLGCVLAPQDGLNAVKGDKKNWWKNGAKYSVYYKDLADRNVFDTRVVQVKHYILPLRPQLACDAKLIDTLAQIENLDVLDLDVVKAIISVAWLQNIGAIVFDNCVSLLNVALLLFFSYNCRNDNANSGRVLPIFLAVLHAKECIECSIFWFSAFGAYFRENDGRLSEQADIYNFLDAIYAVIGFIVIGWIVVGPLLVEKYVEEGWNKALLAIFCGMAWLRLLTSLRGYMWLGVRFLPIIKAILDSASFFFITGMCLLASSHAYYHMGPRNPDPLPVFFALVIPFRLGILGDFHLFEFEGNDNDTKYIEKTGKNGTFWAPMDPEPGDDHFAIMLIFFMTSIGITLVLMNMFIAVLTQNLEVFQGMSRQMFIKSRAKMLKELNQRPWNKCLCCCPSSRLPEKPIEIYPENTGILFCILCPLTVVFGFQGRIWFWSQCKNTWRTAAVLLLFPAMLLVSILLLICRIVLEPTGLQHELRVLLLGIYGWQPDEKNSLQVKAYRAKDCVIHVFVPVEPSEEPASQREALRDYATLKQEKEALTQEKIVLKQEIATLKEKKETQRKDHQKDALHMKERQKELEDELKEIEQELEDTKNELAAAREPDGNARREE